MSHSRRILWVGFLLAGCGGADDAATAGSGKKHLNGEFVSEYSEYGLKIVETRIFGPGDKEAVILIQDGIADAFGEVCDRTMYEGYYAIAGDSLEYTEMRVSKQPVCANGWQPTYGIPQKFKYKMENLTDTSFDVIVDGGREKYRLVE